MIFCEFVKHGTGEKVTINCGDVICIHKPQYTRGNGVALELRNGRRIEVRESYRWVMQHVCPPVNVSVE